MIYPTCFTCDIDWALEDDINTTLNTFERWDIPISPFITHHSPTLLEYYGGHKKRFVGVHPNFRAGSTQGATATNVVFYVKDLWPSAVCYRSHAYYDTPGARRILYENGFRYGSDPYLHLREGIEPVRAGGLTHLPVFLEDDVVLFRAIDKAPWRRKTLLNGDGLKIIDIHPVYFAKNPKGRKFTVELANLANEPVYINQLWDKYENER